MPDKPQHTIALSAHGLLALEGPDATRFAQAQFANDVQALATGHWQWNAWLTAKGRVIALFALLRLDEHRLWLLLPDADAGALRERLAAFVFRSKLTLAVRDDWQVRAEFAAPQHARGAALAIGSAIEVDMGSDADPRRLWLLPTSAAATALAETDGHGAWRRADLLAGVPRLDATQAERWTPQQLSLERLRAFSVKKGCYPGQEIVARTHFLGQAKRHLALFETAGHTPLTAGMAVLDASGQTRGEVVSVADDPAHDHDHDRDHARVLLAVMHEGEHGTLTCASVTLHPRAIVNGLAR